MVRGVKSSKSKMLPLTLPMSYSELVLFKGKGMYTLNEGFLIDSFQEMLKDIYTRKPRATLAQVVAEG